MRFSALLAFFLLLSTYKSASANDTLAYRQADGTTIHLLAAGDVFAEYIETLDGYTLLQGDLNMYFYAVTAKRGNLVPGSLVAHDPSSRTSKELNLLDKTPKHLRISGQTAAKVKAKREKFEHDIQLKKNNQTQTPTNE